MSDYQMMLVYVIQSKYMYTKYTQQYNYTHTVTFCEWALGTVYSA